MWLAVAAFGFEWSGVEAGWAVVADFWAHFLATVVPVEAVGME